MIAIVLLSAEGFENTLLPEAKLDASIGGRLLGCDIAFYRSGWLYLSEGFGLVRKGTPVSTPLPVNRSATYLLTGTAFPVMIVIRRMAKALQTEELHDVNSFSVGRSSANDFVYRDPLVSACHGRFSTDGEGGFFYADMSTNGSYVNGQYMRGKKVKLKPNDEILVPPLLRFTFINEDVRFNQPDHLLRYRLEKEEERVDRE